MQDVDFLGRRIEPAVQHPADPLKSDMASTAIPIADTLVGAISMQLARWPADTVLSVRDGEQLHPRTLQREIRRVRQTIDGLADGFRFHDLRHYFASLLISEGADVKVVQHRLRHASASTTLDTYGHLWPDSDESTRDTVEGVLADRLTARLRPEKNTI